MHFRQGFSYIIGFDNPAFTSNARIRKEAKAEGFQMVTMVECDLLVKPTTIPSAGIRALVVQADKGSATVADVKRMTLSILRRTCFVNFRDGTKIVAADARTAAVGRMS